jgi:flagellar basal-body rod modification protein FlgD
MDKPSGILPPGLSGLNIDNKRVDAGNGLGQEAFLELMVAQLKNQDPLNPMESGDFLGQIAQFSTVSGIGELQQSFNTLAGALQSSQALQASTIVGREVLVPGETATVAVAGAGTSGAVSLPQASGAVSVKVLDSAGQVVRRLDLGTREAGLNQFAWDGLTDAGAPAPAGTYRLQAEAAVGSEQLAVPVLVSARVESVSLQQGETPRLNLAGLGTVSMDQVQQLL